MVWRKLVSEFTECDDWDINTEVCEGTGVRQDKSCLTIENAEVLGNLRHRRRASFLLLRESAFPHWSVKNHLQVQMFPS